MRCITPYVERKFKRSESAAFQEALRQAKQVHPSVSPTGRTYHSENDWAFEFEVIETSGGDASTGTP